MKQPHNEFTHQLCARWEQLALAAESSQTRVCLLRTGMVLAARGGALGKMLPLLFRFCFGGPIGNGRQYMLWIHIDDMINGINYLLTHNNLRGPYNMVSPYPVNNERFSTTLANILNKKFFSYSIQCISLANGRICDIAFGESKCYTQDPREGGF